MILIKYNWPFAIDSIIIWSCYTLMSQSNNKKSVILKILLNYIKFKFYDKT